MTKEKQKPSMDIIKKDDSVNSEDFKVPHVKTISNPNTFKSYHLLEKDPVKKIIEDEDEYSGINKWGEEYTKTVFTWKEECDEMAFVYDEAAHDRKAILTKFLIILMIINAISSLLAPITFTDSQNPELNLALRIFNSVMTLATTILLGIMQYYRWNETIEDYLEFVTRIDNFLSNLTSELSLPRRLRKDAEEFIRQNKDTFSDIIKSSPEIHPQEYRDILKERYENEEKKQTNLRSIRQQKINNAPVSSLIRQLE